MLKTERKQLILEQLNQHHVVSLEKLVSLLETSESTVRRDLDELEAENKLRRVHGGAELPHSLQEEETIQEKIFRRINHSATPSSSCLTQLIRLLLTARSWGNKE